jgi:putative ATP-binding cassette transporter
MMMIGALGLAGGLSSAGLIAVVNKALHTQYPAGWIFVAFALVAFVKIVCGLAVNLVLVRLTQDSVLRLCDELCARILSASFRTIELVGPARLLGLLTDDISILSAAIQAVPPLAVNVAMLAGCAAYLTYLSWRGSLLMLVFVLVGLLCHKLLLKQAHEALAKAREGRDRIYGHFRTLTEGIKELKLSPSRREVFLRDDLKGTISELRKQNLIVARQYALADGWSQIMFYMLLGTLLFLLPQRFHFTLETLTAFIFAALYASGPIWGLIGAMPAFDRGQEALKRLQQVGFSLESEQPAPAVSMIEQSHPVAELRDIEFAYAPGEAHNFSLGPLSLTLRPGQLTFVIGGNGSGKSTFVRLLTGLYTPQSGEILLDGKLVRQENQEEYRRLFSVVYSDFFLFDRLPRSDDSAVQSLAHYYLRSLELHEKVQIQDGRLSTTNLSQGQRRRLALLTAYLEDRPIFVLDEWAADQDPSYRKVFYMQILPELKRRGKTIVVVTHDDRYFHLGDQLLKLDYGALVEVTNSLAEVPI